MIEWHIDQFIGSLAVLHRRLCVIGDGVGEPHDRAAYGGACLICYLTADDTNIRLGICRCAQQQDQTYHGQKISSISRHLYLSIGAAPDPGSAAYSPQ